MALTFRGSICTNLMLPTPNDYCFVIENCARSRCNLTILRCVMRFDSHMISTGANRIMPLVKARKGAASASGGVLMYAKSVWDTALADPDENVRFRLDPGWAGTESSNISISGTVVTMGSQFSARLCSGAEQWLSYDGVIAEDLEDSPVVLRPGELLAFQWAETSTPSGGFAFMNVAWEEDRFDAGYTVGGQVTLSGVPVAGAKVALLSDIDRDMPNPWIEMLTTDGSGNYSKLLPSAVKAAVHVQHRVGETLYNDDGKPFIAKP